MQVVVKRDKPELVAADVLAVFLRQEKSLPPKSVVAQLDARLNGCIRDYLDSGDFSGALNSTALVRTGGAIQAPRATISIATAVPMPSQREGGCHEGSGISRVTRSGPVGASAGNCAKNSRTTRS